MGTDQWTSGDGRMQVDLGQGRTDDQRRRDASVGTAGNPSRLRSRQWAWHGVNGSATLANGHA